MVDDAKQEKYDRVVKCLCSKPGVVAERDAVLSAATCWLYPSVYFGENRESQARGDIKLAEAVKKYNRTLKQIQLAAAYWARSDQEFNGDELP